MKLETYRVDQKKFDVRAKHTFFSNLYKNVLIKDPYWHFFLDPEGATLRFQSEFSSQVREFAKSYRPDIKIKRSTPYNPKFDEYYGVAYLGDDILPLFHDMSILSAFYPSYVMMNPVFERLNHGLVNMAGIHDFHKEAEIYLNLAYGRMEMSGRMFGTPKWLHKLLFRFFL